MYYALNAKTPTKFTLLHISTIFPELEVLCLLPNKLRSYIHEHFQAILKLKFCSPHLKSTLHNEISSPVDQAATANMFMYY